MVTVVLIPALHLAGLSSVASAFKTSWGWYTVLLSRKPPFAQSLHLPDFSLAPRWSTVGSFIAADRHWPGFSSHQRDRAPRQRQAASAE
jgi:hypothetical protein